jgi:DNA-directed RNA polymerase subunit L
MEFKVVKKDKNLLILELPGESYTLTNLVCEQLWEDHNVSEAAQVKEHPYLAEPKIFVRTTRGLPATALARAAKRLADQVKEFKESFQKALS